MLSGLHLRQVIKNAPMHQYTTIKIGGPVDYLAIPENVEQLCGLICHLRQEEIPFFVAGNGSNLLVADAGFRGVCVLLSKNMSGISVDGEIITAQCGASLAAVASAAQNAGLAGIEFAGGIPGTVGGAVVMNAGAYDGEMANVVIKTTFLDVDGNLQEYNKEQCQFSYRHSVFSENQGIVISCSMRLQSSRRDEIADKMKRFNQLRREKQPLNLPSAGSAFKRPAGHYAAKLIEDAGLKGYCVGGAQVSEKHAGFIVNKGGATAAEMMELIQHVRNRINQKFGVMLEPEIRMIGMEADLSS